MSKLSEAELITRLNHSITDNNILHKELKQLKLEHGELLLRDSENRGEINELESEVRRLKEESELKSRGLSDLGDEMRVVREKYEEMEKKNKKLKWENELISDVANVNYKRFEHRLIASENYLAAIKRALGEQRRTVGNAPTAEPQETIESLGSDKVVLVGTHAEPITDIKATSTDPICISDSDDEDESKWLKRKLDFGNAPKKCEHNVSGFSAKRWENETQMLNELKQNTELCMKAVCVLYKQHTTVGKPRGFKDGLDLFWGMALGKRLIDGDKDGRLKKSVAELRDYNRKGPNKCRSIAISHSRQLFEIYKNKEDPNFCPSNYSWTLFIMPMTDLSC